MAGIEEAYNQFIKRISNKEKSTEEMLLNTYAPYFEQNLSHGGGVVGLPPIRGFELGGRVGYGLGGIIGKAFNSMGTKLSEKLTEDQKQKLLDSPNKSGGMFGSLRSMFSRILNKPSGVVTPVAEAVPPASNPLTAKLGMAGFNNPEILNIFKRLGFESGGRVSMSNGGEVNTNLTRTVPPIHGPTPYGLESMFKKRYN